MINDCLGCGIGVDSRVLTLRLDLDSLFIFLLVLRLGYGRVDIK